MVDGIKSSSTTVSGNLISERMSGSSQISTTDNQDGTIAVPLYRPSPLGSSSSLEARSSSTTKVLQEDLATMSTQVPTWTWELFSGLPMLLTQNSLPISHHQENIVPWPMITENQDSLSTEDGTMNGLMTFTHLMLERLLDHHMLSPTLSHNLDRSLEAPS